MSKDGWKRKLKGTAYIYTHPDVPDGRAVVESPFSVTFNGAGFASVVDAKKAAIAWAKLRKEYC